MAILSLTGKARDPHITGVIMMKMKIFQPSLFSTKLNHKLTNNTDTHTTQRTHALEHTKHSRMNFSVVGFYETYFFISPFLRPHERWGHYHAFEFLI